MGSHKPGRRETQDGLAERVPPVTALADCPARIVLVRHGKPKVDVGSRLSPAEFGRWVADYDAAGIDPDYPPPTAARAAARQCAAVVCSHLPRSQESARALGAQRIDVCEPMFREMEMPHGQAAFPKLPPSAWAVIFRLLWAAGYSARVESFLAARARARRCAERLVELAAAHGSVMLVGHGTLNWFIARHLARLGWRGPPRAPRRHWEFGIYARPAG